MLLILTSILCIPACYTKFVAALPITRICLLLLGDKPTPLVATQILTIIGISVSVSISFLRKFELITGWNVLKTVLPSCWGPTVNEVAFYVLGRLLANGERSPDISEYAVVCPQMVPVILAALKAGLSAVARNCEVIEESDGKLFLSLNSVVSDSYLLQLQLIIAGLRNLRWKSLQKTS